MFVSGWKWKTRKIIPLPSHLMNRYCLSRKIPIEKEKKQERKKERKKYGYNTNQTERSSRYV